MNRTHHPSRLAAVALMGLLLATLLGACGAATPTPAPDDPYAMLAKSMDATYDRVKLQVGLKTSGGSPDITIDPQAIEIVVDSKAGVGSFHLSLPTSALNLPASTLAPLGITGDTLDLDLVVDKTGVYAKSPIATALIPILSAQTGQAITGDLAGWLRLATSADLTTLGQVMAQLPAASPAASAAASAGITDLDAAQLRTELEKSGVTLAFAGSEQRNGADARHVTIAVDLKTLLASDLGKEMPAAQRAQLEAAAGQGTVKADVWFNAASGALSEVDIQVLGTGSQGAQITVLVSDPGAVTIAAPATYTEVPLTQMVMPLVQQLLSGGVPTP